MSVASLGGGRSASASLSGTRPRIPVGGTGSFVTLGRGRQAIFDQPELGPGPEDAESFRLEIGIETVETEGLVTHPYINAWCQTGRPPRTPT